MGTQESLGLKTSSRVRPLSSCFGSSTSELCVPEHVSEPL